jgi:hypothetical protein
LAVILALLALGGLMVLPGGAGAATRAPLGSESTLQLPAPSNPFPDTLIHPGPRMSRQLIGIPTEKEFPVLGGEQVKMSSTYYSDADMQTVANVLGGLVHGQEMNTLSVYVASPDELTQICGSGALACYAPSQGEMFISGEDGSSFGVPRDYTIAHEYGHHIANSSLNAPWTALDTGAKRWSTYEHVCQGTRKGRLFPGDEGTHYWENPGEGFAETNAHLNYPDVSVPWGYDPLLHPVQASMAKLQADITDPWTGPTSVTWNGSLWPQRDNPAQRRFATPLDGQVEIDLSGPAGANYDLYVLGDKLPLPRHLRERYRRAHRHHHRLHRLRPRRRIVSRAVTGGSNEQIGLNLCGQSAIHVEVRRRSGSGPFSVSVTRP